MAMSKRTNLEPKQNKQKVNRRTGRCAWIDENGAQCEAAIRNTASLCHDHEVLRRALEHESSTIDEKWLRPSPEGMLPSFAPNMYRTQEGRYQIRLQVRRLLKKRGYKIGKRPGRDFVHRTSATTIRG